MLGINLMVMVDSKCQFAINLEEFGAYEKIDNILSANHYGKTQIFNIFDI